MWPTSAGVQHTVEITDDLQLLITQQSCCYTKRLGFSLQQQRVMFLWKHPAVWGSLWVWNEQGINHDAWYHVLSSLLCCHRHSSLEKICSDITSPICLSYVWFWELSWLESMSVLPKTVQDKCRKLRCLQSLLYKRDKDKLLSCKSDRTFSITVVERSSRKSSKSVALMCVSSN